VLPRRGGGRFLAATTKKICSGLRVEAIEHLGLVQVVPANVRFAFFNGSERTLSRRGRRGKDLNPGVAARASVALWSAARASATSPVLFVGPAERWPAAGVAATARKRVRRKQSGQGGDDRSTFTAPGPLPDQAWAPEAPGVARGPLGQVVQLRRVRQREEGPCAAGRRGRADHGQHQPVLPISARGWLTSRASTRRTSATRRSGGSGSKTRAGC